MNIVSSRDKMIFRKDYNGKPIYSIGLSKKKKDGSYENGYILVNFREGTELEDRSKIKIKDAWLSFYLKEKATVPTIFINDFDLVGVQKPKEAKKEENPFEDFGNSIKTESNFDTIQINDEDLPF